MAIAREQLPDDGGPAVEFDSVDAYVDDRSKELDADVLQGIRELDNADGIKWSVSRVGDEDANRNGFLAKIGTSQLSAEYLRNKFGAGRYYVRGNYPSGKYAAHRTFEIAADAPRTALNVNGAAAPAGGFDVARFLAEQEIREEARAEKRRRERNELLALIIPATAPIVAAMVGRQGPDISALVAALKGPSMPEMMAGLASLKALVPEQTTDPFDRAMKIMDRIQDSGGPKAGETGWFDLGKELIKAVGPTLGPALEARLQLSGASAPAPGTLLASPATADVTPASTGTEDPKMFAQLIMLPWLKTQLTMALAKAQKNSDPSLVAEWILEELPAGVSKENVAQLLSRSDWWEQLQHFAPAVAPYSAWFAQMREAMLAEVLDASDAPPPMRVTEKPPSPVAPAHSATNERPVEMPAAPPKLA